MFGPILGCFGIATNQNKSKEANERTRLVSRGNAQASGSKDRFERNAYSKKQHWQDAGQEMSNKLEALHQRRPFPKWNYAATAPLATRPNEPVSPKSVKSKHSVEHHANTTATLEGVSQILEDLYPSADSPE